jgi:hypothetical protein
MSKKQQRDVMIFRCDTPGCGAQHLEPCTGNWDESRMAFVQARDIGWRLTKASGRWFAECPSCAGAISYRSADDVSEILGWR